MSDNIENLFAEIRSKLEEAQDSVEETLRRGSDEHRYADFVRSVTDWVWETDDKLNYTLVSEGGAGVFGIPVQTLVGRYIFALSHFPNPDDKLMSLVNQIEMRRPFRNVALTIADPDGVRKRILLSGVPVFATETGAFVGYRGTGLDATRRQDDADTVRESEERLRTAAEAGRVGVWDWELESGALFLASNLKQQLGMEANDEKSHVDQWIARFPEEDALAFRNAAREHVDGKTDAFEVEHGMRHSDGSTRWFLSRGRAIRDAAGTAVRITGTSIDITGHKTQEDALREASEAAEFANRAKTDFLAYLSHELRTPLNAIIGYSEAMKENLLGPITEERTREYAGDVFAASTHLLQLIDDMLDLSKIEAGQVELDEREIDVPSVLKSAMDLVEPRAKTGGVRLTLATNGDLPGLQADERLVKQMVVNLLSNAVKFTSKGGVVTIWAERNTDGAISLGVSDTGIGIAQEDVSLVMSPFGQVREDLSVRPEGIGLGLPLVRSLAELHGGKLELQSQKGIGTNVAIHFPANRTCAAA